MAPAAEGVTAALHEIRKLLDEAIPEGSEAALAGLLRIIDDLRLRGSPTRAAPAGGGDSAQVSTSAEHDVERSLRITQESVDSAPVGIFRLDLEGRVVSANLEACRSLGYTRDELLALRIFDFNPGVTPEGWKALRSQPPPAEAQTFVTRHRRKDGSLFPVEVSVRQFDFEGESYAVSFTKDITERVNAERDRARLESSMLQAQKLESLGVLAGGIAHDFNNLLMVIIGNLELALCEIPSPAKERELLREVDRAAKQAADLCRQLLVYAGQGTSKIEPVNLTRLLREQAHMLEVTASKSIRLLLNLAEPLPLINGDVAQLHQVFMNLVMNAADAIGQAPGVISIAADAMVCDKEYLAGIDSAQPLVPGRYVLLEVADTGCGMDAGVRARIFDPFFSTKQAGRGLGLAAVRGIVNKHGGGIRVQSEPGKGTTFRILFPVPEALAQPTAQSPAMPSWRGHGLVLLIDDEAALRSLGSRMLGRLGFETLLAANGVEGLALFKAHSPRIDYVLLDWTMPEMGGGQTLRELRQLDRQVRVVLASGHAPDEILRAAGVEQASAVVRKPYTLDELARAFQEASRT